MGVEQSVLKNRTGNCYSSFQRSVCDENMAFTLKNNYKPLHFHQVHGDNIKLSRDKTVACRPEGFCRGIVFSDRPVMVLEPIYIKFLETSPNWSGALRIGFTMNDPITMKSKLPRYACPDLTAIQGNWAKAISEKLARKDSILYYYVDNVGDVHYGIDAEEYGVFFGGVNTSGKLWAVLDIYGNTVAVEFINPCLYNIKCFDDLKGDPVCKIKHNDIGPILKPLSFHKIHGKNVIMKQNRSIVLRLKDTNSFIPAYVFTEQPIEIGQKLLMSVRGIDHLADKGFVYGITSCNPTKIDPSALPVNADDLHDRPEYWVVKHENPLVEAGDIIAILISNEGKVTLSINKSVYSAFFVDHTQPLWLFISLSYSICEVQLLGIACSNSLNENLEENFDNLKISNGAHNAEPGPSGHHTSTNECVICCEELVDCALYRCGHMCMCYKCALKLFDSDSSNAQCPICRNSIEDVIKVYK